MIIKNAKNKKHIRTIHPGRSICIALLTLLVFNTASVYAASEVIIVAGTGSGVSQFADYNSNTTVANSYIEVDSSVPFSNAFNALSRNIAKLTSTAASNNLYINTTNSYIATLYTYLSNNLPGQWQTLTDIKTNTANTAVATNAALTFLADLETIEWKSGPWQFEYYTTPSGFQPSLDTAYSYQTYPRLYVRFGAGTLVGQNVFKVTIPVTAASNDNRNNFIDHVALYRDNVLLTDDFIEYYYSPELQQIYLYFKSIPSYGFNIAIFFNNNWILRSGTPAISYVPYDTLDYYLVSYLGALEEIANKNFTADITGDVIVDTTDLENKIDEVIDAIDDVSLVSNNVKLNLTINNNTGSDGTTIIGRLQQFLNTGVSVGDFFDNVDAAESGWFSQSNSDVINTLSRGYTDFYE